jgi:hypothetical protein
VIAQGRNQAVGAAIVAGYKRATQDGMDAMCVMAADKQMDPAELERSRARSSS